MARYFDYISLRKFQKITCAICLIWLYPSPRTHPQVLITTPPTSAFRDADVLSLTTSASLETSLLNNTGLWPIRNQLVI